MNMNLVANFLQRCVILNGNRCKTSLVPVEFWLWKFFFVEKNNYLHDIVDSVVG
jgi:hypothetical protein